jgi:hypothetical protein
MDIEIIKEAAPAADGAPNPVMDTILEWIGFDQEATRTRIREEGFETFADLATMKEKDIRDLAESYICPSFENWRLAVVAKICPLFCPKKFPVGG